ncbi:hypothetical protein ED733_001885 [Metarhizium rileyi]|uniref:NADP-dependent oxidoreductase domain-containing protein n=1 Tax=Metarhizium rileyi (strain RCEF 4871) TaxID=1649241 RepID=A0A5C6G0Q7_METRR|nr:hypothetical protein ED733_001885 [Metarhizium rileyi]
MTNQTTEITPVLTTNGNHVSPAKTALKVVLGAMTVGEEGSEGARIHEVKDICDVLDVLQKHGHNEIDTARVYGASEELLGRANWQKKGIIMDTKLNPRRMGPHSYSHNKEDLKRGLEDSLKALQTDQIDCWYLHTPDRNTPYTETLEAVNELYKAGHFKRFGISNYAAWEVALICEVCERNGWKKPDVYQGCYHALQRAVEPELFPCLRNYGIAFYAFSPLAGGMLTGKYQRDTTVHEPGSRYDPKRFQGKSFRGRYWNDEYFGALDKIRPIAQKLGLTSAEAALRWLSHHSALKEEHGDGIIIGASSMAQLEANLADLEKGPLPEELVKAFEEAWGLVKGVCKPYYM